MNEEEANVDQITTLSRKLRRLERSDRQQWAKLRQQQLCNAIFVCCISLGGIMLLPNLDAETKKFLEGFATTLITAGVAGMVTVSTGVVKMPVESQFSDEGDDDDAAD